MTTRSIYGYRYNWASGQRLSDSWFVAERSGKYLDWHWDQCVGFIGRWVGDDLRIHRRRRAWFRGLWVSPSGTLYSAESAWGDSSGLFVGSERSDGTYEWTRAPVEGLVTGVFGLHDDHVIAWGRRIEHARTTAPFVVLWDGASWRDLGAPGVFHAIHGVRPDLMFGVGDDGLIARWDGSRWTAMDPPVRAHIGSVWVVSDDEVYASAAHAIFEGSIHGWLLRATTDSHEMASNLVTWQGDLYVGAGASGLAKVHDERIEIVEPHICPTSLYAGEALLMCDRDHLWSRAPDGELSLRAVRPLIAKDQY